MGKVWKGEGAVRGGEWRGPGENALGRDGEGGVEGGGEASRALGGGASSLQ